MYRGLDPQIYVLFVGRIINSLGSFVFPFMTLLFTKKLGLPPEQTGLIITLSSLLIPPGSIIGGKIADSFGRKKILVLSQIIAAVCYISCGFFAESVFIIPLILLAMFFFGTFMPASKAIVTDLSTPETRKAAFSLLYLGHNIGFAIGPMVAGFLFEKHTPWIFWGDGMTSIISIILIALFVGESKPDESYESVSEHEKGETLSLIPALLKRPFLLSFILITMILSFVYGQMNFSLPLQLDFLFGTNGPKNFGMIMTINAAIVVGLTAPVIAATKKILPVHCQALTSVLYIIGFGMLFFVKAFFWFIISTIVWTIGEIISATNAEVYIANHTPVTHRGRFGSIFSVLSHTGQGLGPLIMGMYISGFGVLYVWPMLALLSLITTVLYLILGWIERRHESRKR